MKVVCNSSVLIALEHLEKLSLLKDLFETICIPEAVRHEVFKREITPAWIKTVKIKQPLAACVLETELELGESEAICLYQELKADLLIIDDLLARRVAERLHARITGTLGVLLIAKHHNLIPKLKPYLVRLNQVGFRISEELFEKILILSDEV